MPNRSIKTVTPVRVLAIDPGYERLGIAIVERDVTGKDVLLFSECFQTPAEAPFSTRLHMLGQEISRIIEEFKPTTLGIETLFMTSNQKTVMRVSEARGVVIYEAAKKGLLICEYSPLQIKIATTGYGRSDKKQVISMIPRLVMIEKNIKHDDEYDAIACAITCLASQRLK